VAPDTNVLINGKQRWRFGEHWQLVTAW